MQSGTKGGGKWKLLFAGASVGAIAVLLMAGIALWRERTAELRSAQEEGLRNAQEKDALAADLSELRAAHKREMSTEVARAVRAAERRGSDKGESTTIAANLQEPDERTEEEVSAAEYEHSKKIADYADEYFEHEAVDPTWGPGRARDIEQAFGNLTVPGFSLSSAACRATICRVVIDRKADGVTQTLGPEVAKLGPLAQMGKFFHYEKDAVYVYAPREGYDFPNPPKAETLN